MLHHLRSPALLLSALGLAASACATSRTPSPTPSPVPPAGASVQPGVLPDAAGQGGAGATGATTAAGGAAARAPSYRSLAALTEGATARPGFFDTYEKDGHLYIVVPHDRLGEDFLLSYEIAQGIGARGLYGGTMFPIFEGAVVALERHEDKLYLVERPMHYRAPARSATETAVQLSYGSSVLETARIEAWGKDSAAVIDIRDWVLSDLSDVGQIVRQAVSPRPGVPGRALVDRSRSYVESVKAFPENVNVRAQLTFVPGEPVAIPQVPDSRYVPLAIHYTFAKLPAQPMTPREADDRMGYFITAHKDFTRDDESFFVRHVNRWRLECSEERVGDLCVPKKPIVYYIDPSVPEAYRPAMMAGVKAWAQAFEAAGFKDAIHAEMLPDSADAEDIRYPTLRWSTSDQPAYGAIGPSIVDPRTGEILDADILFEAQMVRGFKRDWRTSVSPAAAVEGMLGSPDVAASTEGASGAALESPAFADALSSQGSLLRAVLAARGEIGPDDPVPAEYVNQALTWVTMHEVGHTLGLRHNFRSSADTPLDKLYDAQWTAENGVYSSVMEYPSLNVPPTGTAPGLYYNSGVGSSDRWVISYGYVTEAARAKQIAREAARAGHAFGTDEDARGPGALDPTVNPYDMSADPLAWGKQRAALVSSLLPTLPQRALADDRRYADLTDALNTLLNEYVRALATGVKYIGGQYQYRDHVGDPDGRAPFVPVPKAKQREALAFLETAAFGEGAFDVPRGVLAKLGANRWSHWGEDNTYNGRIDYPLHEQVLGAQRALIAQVMNPFVFARIRDAEAKFGSASVLTIPEFMGGLTESIWSEVYGGAARNVRASRRDLQRLYVDRMTELVVGAPDRMPADARAVARYQLAGLKRRIDARLAAGGRLDAYTRAHLGESSARIGKVLDASMNITPGQ